MTTLTTPLEFVSRGTRADTLTSERTIWRSRCGRYRIESHRQLFGRAVGREQRRGYPDYFLLCRAVGDGWRIVSRHRSKSAAEVAAQVDVNTTVRITRRK